MNRKPFFAYRSFRKEFDAMREFHAAGVNQFCVFPAHSTNSLGEPYSEYPPTWLAPEVYDFAPFDQQIEDVKKISPNPEILCMVDLNSPSWLARRLNVAHCGPADSFLSLTDALASPAWFEATRNYMEALIRHAEEKYGNLICCYILACGTTDEWMDYSNGRESLQKLNRYREWVNARGEKKPECIPSYVKRFHAPHNGLRDPQEDAEALRYWQFHSELVADSILRFAEAARALIPAEKQIGVFYGYVLELSNRRLVQAGHLAYEKILASDQVNFLISPGSYQDRELGGGGGFMTPNGSLHLAGKGCLHECDHRTHTANLELNAYTKLTWMPMLWKNEAEDIAGLRREFCRSLFHGTSLWWFDMWENSSSAGKLSGRSPDSNNSGSGSPTKTASRTPKSPSSSTRRVFAMWTMSQMTILPENSYSPCSAAATGSAPRTGSIRSPTSPGSQNSTALNW